MTKLSSCWLVQNSNIPKLNIDSLTVGSIDVALVTVIWISMQGQIHKTCKSGFFHLYNIRRIRKYLSQESASYTYITATAFYLVYPLFRLLKMQRLQNAAARVISNSDLMFLEHQYYVRYIGFLSNFVLILKYFFLLLKLYIYGHARGYLIHLIAIKEQPRYLRSASGLFLKYPSLKLKKTLGDRASSSAAPNLWNNLPLHPSWGQFMKVLNLYLKSIFLD